MLTDLVSNRNTSYFYLSGISLVNRTLLPCGIIWLPFFTHLVQFMTEGILIREMMADPLLTNYSVIMLDEVHERSINTDIVMGLMKKILKVSRRFQ